MATFVKLKPGIYLVDSNSSFNLAVRDFTYPAKESTMKPSARPGTFPSMIVLSIGYNLGDYYLDVKFMKVDVLTEILRQYSHTK
jgi:hypothetical protein